MQWAGAELSPIPRHLHAPAQHWWLLREEASGGAGEPARQEREGTVREEHGVLGQEEVGLTVSGRAQEQLCGRLPCQHLLLDGLQPPVSPGPQRNGAWLSSRTIFCWDWKQTPRWGQVRLILLSWFPKRLGYG